MDKQQLLVELQSKGLQLAEQTSGAAGRKGGAGPSDHKAIVVDGTTVMVPVYTGTAAVSPYRLSAAVNSSPVVPSEEVQPTLECHGQAIASVQFPKQPKFYGLQTADGIPYWKIALLHSHDVLATTVLQTCMRYNDRATACQFCAIGQSLAADRTIARKTPDQLAEVTEAAVRLDGIKHVVMTTGTPNTPDRGAAYLTECARAIKARVDIPIQAQCEPPADFSWFERMKAAGINSLGMHLEAVTPEVRDRIMPGKATVSLETYFEAFAAAVQVFGWGQVSTYLLAGLGDSLNALVDTSDRLIQLGVYPFIVPFVPITGTPLEDTAPPDSEFMYRLYQEVGQRLKNAGLSSQDVEAGCAKCGACSALSAFET
ncbi:MSMEG_0568 family radical SAM protein [Leptolyngbya sp. CCY15150]|uniref:MSMEG_0568 family radical SAM protein n=1 Tax=Leptolyngbya sp. CCY15150 TaxID=2767772 RepID=UPI00194EB19F|nr:MSMEG_0568 family radical SAM protein [Leptolyngbya sp. CCY15150]